MIDEINKLMKRVLSVEQQEVFGGNGKADILAPIISGQSKA
ncbi:hypothetical protein [Paenibacillus aestuarii]|uniref:Uncharacterized protein n=1 Tax=Paenibacillus aestuarii TaxID=516965 RepID=A0ABW0K1P6_9BACL|nr:hypothetical protein [Paenibacillus aestuarii]